MPEVTAKATGVWSKESTKSHFAISSGGLAAGGTADALDSKARKKVRTASARKHLICLPAGLVLSRDMATFRPRCDPFISSTSSK
jgi:hypothetical protein